MRKIFVGLLCLVTILGIFIPKFVSAEISHPYVVDDKPQVIFGDSATIEVPNEDHTATTTYRGLENYTQDYVNGFAHLTFTYTHHFCCYAGYPPLLYITDSDPTTTISPVQKWLYYPYHIPSYSGIATDWYLYDIQFDDIGYDVVVKQAGVNEIYNARFNVDGLTTTDWVALANNDIGNPPGSLYSFAFAPVPIIETSSAQTINPVIIIPGIMGSDYSPLLNKLVIDPVLHTYDNLIATFEANGYIEDKTMFTFPYE